MTFTFDDLIKATQATVLHKNDTSGNFSISTDSRKIDVNSVYIPLKGEKFDGHDFIKSAVEKGSKGYFTQNKDIVLPEAEFVLYVEDTLTAYLQLASYYKKKIKPITVAITGSSGKTTTKEMTASVVQKGYKTHKSILNHNNEIGLCETMLSMPEDTEVLIAEMGMRGAGEIELLSKYTEPDIAVIANTGTAHIGRLGTVRKIAEAKCEITKYMHPEGVLFAHDTKLIRSVNKFKGQTVYLSLESPDVEKIKLNTDSSEFVYKNQKYKLNVEGRHNIQNALFAINVGLKLGISPALIAEGLAEYKPIEKRWEIVDTGRYKIINDSYNSNPESLKAAVSTFLSTQNPPRLLVLGDMGELGKDEVKYHKEIGEFLNSYRNFRLVTVGKLAKYFKKTLNSEFQDYSVSFKTNHEAAEYIKENIEKNTSILFKASRFMHFEEIIEEISKQ